MDIDKIVSIIRSLKEDAGMMTTSSTPTKAGFGGTSQEFDPGPTSGYDKVMKKMMRRRTPQIIAKGKFPGLRTRWNPKKNK